jgi:hypothetical protein
MSPDGPTTMDPEEIEDEELEEIRSVYLSTREPVLNATYFQSLRGFHYYRYILLQIERERDLRAFHRLDTRLFVREEEATANCPPYCICLDVFGQSGLAQEALAAIEETDAGRGELVCHSPCR